MPTDPAILNIIKEMDRQTAEAISGLRLDIRILILCLLVLQAAASGVFTKIAGFGVSLETSGFPIVGRTHPVSGNSKEYEEQIDQKAPLLQ